jgi:hypothetical protein
MIAPGSHNATMIHTFGDFGEASLGPCRKEEKSNFTHARRIPGSSTSML